MAAEPTTGGVPGLLDEFLALPGKKSAQMDVEAGRLSETEQLTIDDAVRSVGGGVFEHLTGTTAARNILEAMIAHSDNTATDIALARVGPDKVRAFIAEAGLTQARIPDSTR